MDGGLVYEQSGWLYKNDGKEKLKESQLTRTHTKIDTAKIN